MNFEMQIGYVIEIQGKNIIIETNHQSNDLTYFYNGEIFRGTCVGQYIGILRGPYLLVARIEREFLDNRTNKNTDISYKELGISRKLEVSLIGFFDNKSFNIGIIAYPMIYNNVIMLNDYQISKIINDITISDKSKLIELGKTVNEKSDVFIDITKLFNTHIGIFGNTGSGKSNTLAKIYTELFNKNNLKLESSDFLFIDFNGEYTGDEVFSQNKTVLKLSTNKKQGDKIKIKKSIFWDIDTLSVMFSATEKTQKPFLNNAINYFLDERTMEITDEKIIEGIGSSFSNTFNKSSSKETNKLLHFIYEELGMDNKNEDIPYYDCKWHETTKAYFFEHNNNKHFISDSNEISKNRTRLTKYLENNSSSIIHILTITQRMKIAIYSHLIYCISFNTAQYEFVNPLIERLKSRTKIIDKLIEIVDSDSNKRNIAVISLKDCNIEAKKMIPLLLVKNSYKSTKEVNNETIQHTFHLIIDEAHNILSEQSIREESAWKDYRLETFEEIIKEGRKFGYYITVASQRPADISQTIVSQLHNYFIHRLISDQDLKMINNTINTIDSVSKASIPLLAPGQCILTGTSFRLPKIVQVTKLQEKFAPNSTSADLERLWFNKNDTNL